MRYLLFFIIVGILFSSSSTAQNQELIKRMELNMLKERHDSVRVIAGLILQTDSTNWMAHYYLGKTAQSDYNYFEAIGHFENANASDSANSVIENALADSYDFIGKDEMAINIYYNQYLRDTLSLEPIVKLATIFRKKNEYGTAIYYYQKAIEIDFDNFYYHKQLGSLYNKIGMVPGALYSYETSLKLNPYDVSIYIQLANLYNSQRLFQHAIHLIDTAFKYVDDNNQLRKIKAYSQYLNRDLDSAINAFSDLISLGDSSQFNLKYRGLAYFDKKEFALAKADLKKSLELNKEDEEVYFYLGSAEGRTGFTDDGINYLNKSLQLISPSRKQLATIYSELAHVYSEAQAYEKSLEYLRLAYKNNANPLLSFKMAQLYDYYLGNKKMAVNYYLGYLTMVNTADSSGLSNKTFHKDSAVVQNATHRLRILKEDLFFEETNKK